MSSTTTVVIPSVELTLDQLIKAIQQLDPEARSKVARALVESELDVHMTELISSLASREPADDITDADVVVEVKAVRELRRQ